LPPSPRSLFEQRPQVITEHPPMFVQRRDSNPTRLEIPDGPIGAPLRGFAAESGSRAATRGSSHARVMLPEIEENDPVLGAAVILPDSLTPPLTSTATDMPEPSGPRTSTLWLVSGAIAAVLVLGVGMGLKHWSQRVGSTPSAVRATPVAPEPALDPAPAAELPEEQAVAPTPPEEVAPPATPAKGEAASASGAGGAQASDAPKPARLKPLKPAALPAAAVEAPSAETAAKRPAPRKVTGLPENPY
jgi:hypothetical protein